MSKHYLDTLREEVIRLQAAWLDTMPKPEPLGWPLVRDFQLLGAVDDLPCIPIKTDGMRMLELTECIEDLVDRLEVIPGPPEIDDEEPELSH